MNKKKLFVPALATGGLLFFAGGFFFFKAGQSEDKSKNSDLEKNQRDTHAVQANLLWGSALASIGTSFAVWLFALKVKFEPGFTNYIPDIDLKKDQNSLSIVYNYHFKPILKQKPIVLSYN